MDHLLTEISGVFCFSLLGLCILCGAAAVLLFLIDLLEGEPE